MIMDEIINKKSPRLIKLIRSYPLNFSNRIANNYTPSSKGLRIHSLKQAYVAERAPSSPRKRQKTYCRSKTAGARLTKARLPGKHDTGGDSSRDYDTDTLTALAVQFPPFTTPTFGLPRSAIPIEPCLERFRFLLLHRCQQ